MTTYKEIFDLALQHITDDSLAQWDEDDLTNELNSWMQAAIFKLPKLKSELSARDEFDVYSVDMIGFPNTLSDTTKEILALSMVREWLRPQINSTSLTYQRYSRKEGYSQKEHLSGLMTLDNSLQIEIKKLLRDNSYVENSYFD